jgi:hypothetical protein
MRFSSSENFGPFSRALNGQVTKGWVLIETPSYRYKMLVDGEGANKFIS